MKWHRRNMIAMVLMAPLIVPSLAIAQGAVSATLSVLTAPVERIGGTAGAPEPGITVSAPARAGSRSSRS